MKQNFVIAAIVITFGSSAVAQTPGRPDVHTVSGIASGTLAKASLQDTTYFIEVDEMPKPVGGMMAMARNVRYPDSAKKDTVEGTVYVEAFLDEKGAVVKTTIVKGVRSDLDQAAQAAVQSTKFTPGKQKGKPVRVRISIPIRFRLSPDEKPSSLPPPGPVRRPTIMTEARFEKLQRSIVYPEIAVRAGIEGMVQVQVLFRNRSISQVNVLRGLGAGCDEAVIRAVATYDFSQDPLYERYADNGSVTVTVHFVLPK